MLKGLTRKGAGKYLTTPTRAGWLAIKRDFQSDGPQAPDGYVLTQPKPCPGSYAHRSHCPRPRGLVQPRLFPFGGDVIAQLIGRIGISMKHELTCVLEDEQVPIEHDRQRAIGRCVTLLTRCVDCERADHGRMFIRSDDDPGNRIRWPKIDQISVRFKPATCAAQGIDHALLGESSQRP